MTIISNAADIKEAKMSPERLFQIQLILGYIAWLLCFRYAWGISGIWVGLTTALILIGAALLLVWRRTIPAPSSAAQ